MQPRRNSGTSVAACVGTFWVTLLTSAPADARCPRTEFCVCDFGATTAVLTESRALTDGGVELVVVETRGDDNAVRAGAVWPDSTREGVGAGDALLVGMKGKGVSGQVVIAESVVDCPRGTFNGDPSAVMGAMLATDCRPRVERISGQRETKEPCRDVVGIFGPCGVAPNSFGVAVLTMLPLLATRAFRRRERRPGTRCGL